MPTNLKHNPTGPRPRHSREAITRIAVALADAQGIGAVSIRGIAAQLGSGPASLYRYVKSLDELIELMIDWISAEYDFASCRGSATEQLLSISRQGREIMRRHPWVPALVLQRQFFTPHALSYLEQGLTALENSPISGSAKLHTLGMLNGITAAFALNERSAKQPAKAEDLLQLLSAGAYPHLSQTLKEISEPLDQEEAFDAAISNFLRGILVRVN